SAHPARKIRWWGRTMGAASSPSHSSRSGGACRGCRPSWSTAAASTVSCPASAPCAGSPISTHKHPQISQITQIFEYFIFEICVFCGLFSEENTMADHSSGPRAIAAPAADIADLFVFPSPERPSHLVLVLNVFPAAAPGALFSDAVAYRFRLRPVAVA